MALSNWDTMAVDLDGKPASSSFTSPSGVTVEVYKNWLYIRDPKAWRESSSYEEPTVAELSNGELCYQDVTIAAKRGPQEGVYAVIWVPGYKYQPKDGKLDYALPERGMIACGVYGYDGHDFVGVRPESVQWFIYQLRGQHKEFYDIDGRQIGIDVSDWDCGAGFPKRVRTLDFSQAVRYNQGDAFFADRASVPVDSTKPGEAGPTVLSQLIDDMKEEI